MTGKSAIADGLEAQPNSASACQRPHLELLGLFFISNCKTMGQLGNFKPFKECTQLNFAGGLLTHKQKETII